MHATPNHPSHEESQWNHNCYMEEIKRVKKEHWMDWLEQINSNEIWIVNHYLNSKPLDGRLA